MDLLTKEQAQELFRQEAMFIGAGDGVPLYRVKTLFGSWAADFARSVPHGSSIFGVGDFQLPYVNLTGFLAAASFHNVEIIRDSRIEERLEDIA